MNDDICRTFSLASFLLQYPDEGWQADREAWRQEVSQLATPQLQFLFADFFAYAEELSAEEFCQQYVRIFDFSKNTNLYLSSHQFGDQRERSQELLRYKEIFAAGGFDIAGELPDYLPAVLEFCARADADSVRRMAALCRKSVEDLRQKLIEGECVQVILLDAVLTAIQMLEREENR